MTTPTAPEPTHRRAPASPPSGPAYPFDPDDSYSAVPTRRDSTRHGESTTPPATQRSTGWPVAWRWISFLAGCALLVWCAWALGDKLPQWSADYGRVLVFLVFFLIMSIAGRWFWKGIDAVLNRVIGGHE